MSERKSENMSWSRTYQYMLTCRDCKRCYEPTMVCNHFNKSVAQGSGVKAHECNVFGLKDKPGDNYAES